MMPQTCYAPRYGCYPGTERYTHRYPAFHGNYYRSAYNYRNYFDYPWHAELHEPTSLFSYETERQDEALAPVVTPAESSPVPTVKRAAPTFPPQPTPTAQKNLRANVIPAEFSGERETLAPIVEAAIAPPKTPARAISVPIAEADEVAIKSLRTLRR